MTDEELREKALARILNDMHADPRMLRQCWSKAECHKIQADVLLELALAYLVGMIEAQDANTVLKGKNLALQMDNSSLPRLREELNGARLQLTQAQSDIYTIMSKLQRLQPVATPPTTDSPVVIAYWIVDHILNNGYFPETKG